MCLTNSLVLLCHGMLLTLMILSPGLSCSLGLALFHLATVPPGRTLLMVAWTLSSSPWLSFQPRAFWSDIVLGDPQQGRELERPVRQRHGPPDVEARGEARAQGGERERRGAERGGHCLPRGAGAGRDSRVQ
ncbi:unnamed protein product [Prorocentrum cordatum]|uniref:Uncharacterized protein n=1 Tax=Prorocentrum cordatum TaxID=2364126 RepID=A0ABN9WPX8_9DINO|nr:unnamed protein product [Polarella glacialis]